MTAEMNGINEILHLDTLVDTNVFIYATGGLLKIEQVQGGHSAVSILTEIELLGKKSISQQEIQQISQLLIGFRILDLSNNIKNKAIEIKQRRNVKLPDAVIAATAIEYNLTLVTADVKLAKVEGLKVKLVQPEMDDTQKNNELN